MHIFDIYITHMHFNKKHHVFMGSLLFYIFYVFVASRVSGVDGETKNQNIWLQVSPYPRPTYGYKGSGKNFFMMRNASFKIN